MPRPANRVRPRGRPRRSERCGRQHVILDDAQLAVLLTDKQPSIRRKIHGRGPGDVASNHRLAESWWKYGRSSYSGSENEQSTTKQSDPGFHRLFSVAGLGDKLFGHVKHGVLYPYP